MKAIGQDRGGRGLVLVNAEEADTARQDAVVVDVHSGLVGPVTAMQSLLGSEFTAEVDPALAARAIKLFREATTTGTLPPAEDPSPAPTLEERMKAVWPELKIESGTSGRAFTFVGVSKRTRDERAEGEGD